MIRVIENGSKIQVKSGYASGLTGKIVSSKLFGGSGKKVVYTILLDSLYRVPYRDDGIDSILLEKQDFIVYG